MWRLFKEVFKSLIKNKATVAGLTILVFLSSAIFTLLHDMSKSMKQQYKKYDEISNGHEFTVDLNLPFSGNIYNNGYFVNGLTQIEGGPFFGKGLNYVEPNYRKIYDSIDIEAIETPYVKMDNFFQNDNFLKDKYIKKSTLTELVEKNNVDQFVIYNFENPEKTFRLTKDFETDLFVKNGEEFVKYEKRYTLKRSDVFHLDKAYKLQDIASISSENERTPILSQMSTLFINVKTKQATFDYNVGKKWDIEDNAVKVSPVDYVEKLGFSKYNDSNFIFKLDNTKSPILISINGNESISNFYEKEIKLNIPYSDIFKESSVDHDSIEKYTLRKNIDFSLPVQWAVKKENLVYWQRKHYTTTYDTPENKRRWNGTYATFMEGIEKENNGSLPLYFSDFSYWSKRTLSYNIKFHDDGSVNNQKILKSENNNIISFEETQKNKLTLADMSEQPLNPNIAEFNYNSYILSESKTIAEIDNLSARAQDSNFNINNWYKDIINVQNVDERVKIIKDGALNITKKSIYDYLVQKVSEANIGKRKTITVDSVNNLGEKSVFHFINTGDKDNKVDGIKLNVDKLINEATNKTDLNEISVALDNYFMTKELPPFIAKEIISNTRDNVNPVNEYILADFDFYDVKIIDPSNNEVSILHNAKVYKLANYIGKNGLPEETYNQFNGYGVAWTSYDTLFLLRAIYNPNNPDQIDHWENVNIPKKQISSFTGEELYRYFVDHNFTLRHKYLNMQGWVEKLPEYPNTVYIPFAFRGPLIEIINEALNQNTLRSGLVNIQKYLFESDLIKKGFLSKEEVYTLIESISVVIDKNNFAKIFSTGNINLIVIPKMALDLVYELSHSPNGDYLTKILTSILNRVKQLILEQGSLENQRNYLIGQIENLYKFIEKISGQNASVFIPPTKLAYLVKDPIKLIDSVIAIINSFNFEEYGSKLKNFFDNEYDKEHLFNGKSYKRKLSSVEIILWAIESFDQNELKKAINSILNNININVILNADDPNSLLANFLTNLPTSIKEIIKKANAYENDPSKAFSNVIEQLKLLIDTIDLNIVSSNLREKLTVSPYDVENIQINNLTKTKEKTIKYYALGSINNIDIYSTIIKSIFSMPGSDKYIKTRIIDMFNLSSKGDSIRIDDNTYISFPVEDPDKLDFIDLVSAFISPASKPAQNAESNPSETSAANSQASPSTNNTLEKVNYFINKFKNVASIEYNNLSSKDRAIAQQFFNLTKNHTLSGDAKNKAFNDWQAFVNAFAFIDDLKEIHSDMSIGNLMNYYANFSNYFEVNFTWSILNKLLKKLTNNSYTPGFSPIKDSRLILKNWSSIFIKNKDISYERRTAFANRLLALANKQGVLDSFNSFNLFEGSDQNIAKYQSTGFGVSRSIATPLKMRDEFFAKDASGRYVDADLKELVRDFPEFEKWIKENELNITNDFAYIGVSQMYQNFGETTKIDKYALKYNNILSVIIDNFLNGVMQRRVIKQKLDTIDYIYNNDYYTVSIEHLGLNNLLFNSLLLNNTPQFIVWLLTNTNNVGNQSISNLAFLLLHKIVNFEDLVNKGDEKISEFINSFVQPSVITPVVENDFTFAIAIDNDYFVNLTELPEYKEDKMSVFGINLVDIMLNAMNSITGLQRVNNLLVFTQASAYVAKVNYAWLKQNNKEIYGGYLPKDPVGMAQLIENVDKKYLLEVDGTKFLILGDDITYDYVYPVIDENNLQVSTKNQAIVYLNDKGFNRIRQNYRGNVVKEYLVAKTKPNQDLDTVIKETREYVNQAVNDPAKLERVFRKDQLDPINPERSLRITVVTGIISSVTYTSNILIGILIALVGISIIFIIKRYISNKNKVIGILVAQGYTPLQISISMTAFAVFSVLIGGVIGYLTGFMFQASAINILSSYWTVPITTLNFSIVSFSVSIIVPLIGMSLLIIAISLYSLRYKSIDLMSGIVDLNIGELQNQYKKLWTKSNIKTKFGASLVFNSFWKLASFAISIILASITTIFGFATFGVFEKSIEKTYKNRSYNYKFDLETPTKEGGLFNPYYVQHLDNSLYTTIGDVSELNWYQSDYFAPGYSTAVNANGKNGNPTIFDPHVISQFSVNVKIDSSVSVDPWKLVYNSLPDTQKSKILKIRNLVGHALEKTQDWVVYEKDNPNKYDVAKTKLTKRDFFYYLENENNPLESQFLYLRYDPTEGDYIHDIISTSSHRDQYRQFLVDGYRKLSQQNQQKENSGARVSDLVTDFFVAFNGIYFNPLKDETYSYVASKYKKQNIKLYGYKQNSSQIKLIDDNDNNLLDLVYKQWYELEKTIPSSLTNAQKAELLMEKELPIVINKVSADKFGLKVGSKLKLPVLNNVERYTEKLNAEIYNLVEEKVITDENVEEEVVEEIKGYKFKVIGINPTFINTEFIIPKPIADIITGLASLTKTQNNITSEPFNGILSKDQLPQQLLWTTALYSISGYSPAADTLDTNGISSNVISDLFDGLFATHSTVDNLRSEGQMAKLGYTDVEIAKFLNKDFDPETQSVKENYLEMKKSAGTAINKFAKIFEDKLYVATASSIDSKEMEIGFTLTIAKTVQIIVTLITIISFIVSIVILIIISTILINENEKNIAIWSILGYNNKEKIFMFFGIYIPFIIGAVLLAMPIAVGLMGVFSQFLTVAASITIPLTLTIGNVALTIATVFGVFLVTSIISWLNINKIKAIDLLKGK